MLHAAFLLVFMLVGRAAGEIHPARGAGRRAGGGVLEHGGEEASSSACCAIGARPPVLLATFGLTLLEDLTAGIVAGCVLAAAIAIIDRANGALNHRRDRRLAAKSDLQA